jgi:hypothetical protein
MMRGLTATVIATSALVTSTSAWAEDAARAAERLFAEGRALDAAGRFDEACARYLQSETLDPAVGTLLNLGTCAERKGQSATALHRYREAAALAARQADAEREALANRHVEELQARQSSLLVRPPRTPLPPGTVVRRDGESMLSTDLGTAVVVDPGTHTVEVDVPGQPAWSTSVVVGHGPALATVDLPEPTLAPPPPAWAPAPARRDGTTDSGATHRTALTGVALGVGIAGVVALAAGSYFGLHARSTWDGVTAACPGGGCSSAAALDANAPRESDAARDGTVGTVALAVGGVALATAIVLYVIDGRTHGAQRAQAAPAAHPSISSSWGVSVFSFE